MKQGDSLAQFEILTQIGVGGMGEVYRARDTVLDRQVAIKILPEQLSSDPDREARFQREAKAISSLNHPAICTLYDVGHQDNIDYIIMEYLEGETLAEKLEQGPLEIPKALDIAVRIADALDSAHRMGLIHRDIKPGNVMLIKNRVKLLDFGLAKACLKSESQGADAGATRTAEVSNVGKIIGTLNYMSPEQVEGKEADQRSDIFAFGALLYEMLTGQKAFEGESPSNVIASILKEQPRPVSDLMTIVPAGLSRLVDKCLKKNPDERWQSASDLADEIRWVSESGYATEKREAVASKNSLVRILPWIITGAAILTIFAIIYTISGSDQQNSRIRRLSMHVEGAGLVHWPRLSPDGNFLVYRSADSSGRYSIWIRPLNSLKPYRLPGTLGATRPFWSPDSRSIAFFQGDMLKKMPVSGGPSELICKTLGGSDGYWGSDETILFDGYSPTEEIMYVSANGGTPVSVTHKTMDDDWHGWPWLLPDGRKFLYVVDDIHGNPTENLLLKVGFIDSDESRELLRVDSRVEYIEPGYIVYVKDGILMAHKFDAENMILGGNPIPIAEDISAWNWGANFSLANDGTLAYQRGSRNDNMSLLLWVDRKGRVLDTLGKPSLYRDIALSPDEKSVAFSLLDPQVGTEDIWIYDLRRESPYRLTFDGGSDTYLAWSPDGNDIYFSSDRNSRYQIFRKGVNTSTEAEMIYSNPDQAEKTGIGTWADKGNKIYIFAKLDKWMYGLLDPEGSKDSVRFYRSGFDQYAFGTSPDERSLVYSSNESGAWEVYVKEQMESGRKWQVSIGGGYDAVWSEDGNEIFYQRNDGSIMAVPVESNSGFRVGIPKHLFTRNIQIVPPKRLRYFPSADGKKFLVNVAIGKRTKSDFVIVLNWLDDPRLKGE